MSYLSFLTVFIVFPLCLLFLNLYRGDFKFKNRYLAGALLMSVTALIYTTPWDNFLVANKVWWYGPDRVLATIGYVPVEEYLFFILQSWFTTALFCKLAQLFPIKTSEAFQVTRFLSYKSLAVFVLVFVWLASVFGLYFYKSFYISLILSWSLPVIIFQIYTGGEQLVHNIRLYLLTFTISSLYLCSVDALAIYEGIWTISPDLTSGWHLGVLPIEEAVFFMVTNVMVIQGVMLFIIGDDLKIPYLKTRSFFEWIDNI